MPKMKTNSSAKKRFRVTGSGKIRRSRAYHNHKLEHKSAKRGQRLRKVVIVDPGNARSIERLLLLK
ncbi:MAG: 50S ribosomal protein L35 [Deltaproteobacteria bacterium]|nr:50S ribosomal protein L35 [Deltaproteobacteria bacterium]MBI3296173.1 50S ribosomal protein L35 [Deltaproteobacteria bacterium]